MTDRLIKDMSGDWSTKGYEWAEFSIRSKFMTEVKLLETDIPEEDRIYLERLLKKMNEQIEEMKVLTHKYKLGLVTQDSE
jgi:hypothetical protein